MSRRVRNTSDLPRAVTKCSPAGGRLDVDWLAVQQAIAVKALPMRRGRPVGEIGPPVPRARGYPSRTP
jgi:hypothetical protein